MKWFTEPTGKFVIQIPLNWQYKNVAAGYKETSPFCFHTYNEANWSFQVSCYSKDEQRQNPALEVQPEGKPKLHFITSNLDDKEFGIKLWFASVADHVFIAKYVYDQAAKHTEDLKLRLQRVESILSTLQLLPLSQRQKAIELDKYEKFMAALAASFDLSNRAIENGAIIELLVITANQIDAYLRMALVLNKQLMDKTDIIDISLLFQGDADAPIMEKKIYKQALNANIIDQVIYDELERLYNERNKIIHRYIITDFKTRATYFVVESYLHVSEIVRLRLAKLEAKQAEEKIGIHKAGVSDMQNISIKDRLFLYSQLNDKHLISDLNRKINDQ